MLRVCLFILFIDFILLFIFSHWTDLSKQLDVRNHDERRMQTEHVRLQG